MITLHLSSASAHSASVRIVLAEKELDHAAREWDLAASEQHEPAFLAINPAGMVPVLEDGGHRLTEAFLVLLYLDERYPDSPLGGADPRARYAVQRWGKYVETHIAPHLAVVRWAQTGGQLDATQLARLERLPPERAALWRQAAEGFSGEDVATSREVLHRAVLRMEQDLARAPWLAGDQFTLADAAVFPHARQFAALGISVPPTVQDWLARVAERPAVRSSAGTGEPLATMGPERGRWG